MSIDQIPYDMDVANLISDTLLKSQLDPLLHLYVDMSTMFDYKLSSILGMIRSQKEYDYIRSRLETYQLYKGREITKIFPALKFTEDDITNFMLETKNHKYLSAGSLITNVSNLVPAQIAMFDAINKQSPMYNKEPINVYFVNEFFPIEDSSRRHMIGSLRSLFPNINCYFFHKKIHTESLELLKLVDHFLLDDIKSFCTDHSNTYNMFLKDRKLLGKSIYATYQLEEEDPFINDNNKEKFKKTEEFFSLFCFFMFFDRQLITLKEDFREG